MPNRLSEETGKNQGTGGASDRKITETTSVHHETGELDSFVGRYGWLHTTVSVLTDNVTYARWSSFTD